MLSEFFTASDSESAICPCYLGVLMARGLIGRRPMSAITSRQTSPLRLLRAFLVLAVPALVLGAGREAAAGTFSVDFRVTLTQTCSVTDYSNSSGSGSSGGQNICSPYSSDPFVVRATFDDVALYSYSSSDGTTYAQAQTQFQLVSLTGVPEQYTTLNPLIGTVDETSYGYFDAVEYSSPVSYRYAAVVNDRSASSPYYETASDRGQSHWFTGTRLRINSAYYDSNDLSVSATTADFEQFLRSATLQFEHYSYLYTWNESCAPSFIDCASWQQNYSYQGGRYLVSGTAVAEPKAVSDTSTGFLLIAIGIGALLTVRARLDVRPAAARRR